MEEDVDDSLETRRMHTGDPDIPTSGGGCASRVLCNRTGLLVLVTGYALLGALLFKTLEGGAEPPLPVQVHKSREDCLKELWLITERLNVLYEKNWTKLVTEQLKRFERAVIESGRHDDSNGHVASSHWTFGSALLYSLTLLTTIGYGKLSPRTAVGKVVAIFYALIGVPLMLILLSTLGSLLAGGAKKGYSKLCCKHGGNKVPKSCAGNSNSVLSNSVIGYHKASTNNSKNCKNIGNNSYSYDECAIQIATNPSQNCYKQEHQQEQIQEMPKKTLLATVRASHARGRCRQMQVRQMLADPQLCPQHSHGSTPSRNVMGHLSGGLMDVEDNEDGDENEHGMCATHDTPSRVPLICRQQDTSSSTPASTSSTIIVHQPQSVPPSVVLCIFVGYVCMGAFAFASASGWTFLDSAYFCFIALTTIGLGDRLPQSQEIGVQVQLFACCLYLFAGLVVVAMCFSLVHEEVAIRCRQAAVNIGLIKD